MSEDKQENTPINLKQVVSGRRNIKKMQTDLIIDRARNAPFTPPGEDTDGWTENRSTRLYNEILPHFHGKNYLDILDGLPLNSTVLDYGCGENAAAIKQLSKIEDRKSVV